MQPETRPRYDLVTLKLQRTPLQLLSPKSLAHPPSTPQSFYLSRSHAQKQVKYRWVSSLTVWVIGLVSQFSPFEVCYFLLWLFFFFTHLLAVQCLGPKNGFRFSLLGFSVKWIGFIVFISLFFTHLLPVQCLGCYHKVWQTQFVGKVFNNILYKR